MDFCNFTSKWHDYEWYPQNPYHKHAPANKQINWCIRYSTFTLLCTWEWHARKTITNFIRKMFFVIIQIKCIFNLDATRFFFFFFSLCAHHISSIQIEIYQSERKKKIILIFFTLYNALLSFCLHEVGCNRGKKKSTNRLYLLLYLLSLEAVVRLIFIPISTEPTTNKQINKRREKKRHAHVCHNISRYAHYVALKNLLLSLRFCTHLQLISISIYIPFFVCWHRRRRRRRRRRCHRCYVYAKCKTTKIRVIIFIWLNILWQF